MAALPSITSASASFLARPSCSRAAFLKALYLGSLAPSRHPQSLPNQRFLHTNHLSLQHLQHDFLWSPPRRFQRFFSVKALDVSGPGSIESSLMVSMQNKLKEQLKAEEVIVKDAYGDGRHVSIDVISAEFEGKSSVNRQRMVYKAIWEELQSTVHAVDNMRTRTPSEAAQEA